MKVVKRIKSLFSINKSYPLYTNRQERYDFILKTFHSYFKETVLDVGCSEAFLKDKLSEDIKYIGIDIEGNPDYIVDLEKELLTQFEDKSFHLVICTEVLEHLDNLYEVFDELTRVSSKYIIISLPNSWNLFKFSLIRGKSKNKIKFYGLPNEKPVDRHKWFFNYDEALEFIKYRAEKNGFSVKTSFPNPVIISTIGQKIFDLLFKFYYRNRFGYNNLHYAHVWALLERDD